MVGLIFPEVRLASIDVFRCDGCGQQFGLLVPSFAEIGGIKAVQAVVEHSKSNHVIVVGLDWTSRSGLTCLNVVRRPGRRFSWESYQIPIKCREGHFWPGDLTPGWKWRTGTITRGVQLVPEEIEDFLELSLFDERRRRILLYGRFLIHGAGKRQWTVCGYRPDADEVKKISLPYTCRKCRQVEQEKQEPEEISAPNNEEVEVVEILDLYQEYEEVEDFSYLDPYSDEDMAAERLP